MMIPTKLKTFDLKTLKPNLDLNLAMLHWTLIQEPSYNENY
jgi:hypothetical protein